MLEIKKNSPRRKVQQIRPVELSADTQPNMRLVELKYHSFTRSRYILNEQRKKPSKATFSILQNFGKHLWTSNNQQSVIHIQDLLDILLSQEKNKNGHIFVFPQLDFHLCVYRISKISKTG